MVVTQHRTDPRLGPALLDELQAGLRGTRAVVVVASATRTATGASSGRSTQAAARRPTPVSCCGRSARSWRVATAWRSATCSATTGWRQRWSTRSSRAPGRSPTGCWPPCVRASAPVVRSASCARRRCSLSSASPFPLIDLRVDDDPDPLGRLDALWEVYRPLVRGSWPGHLTPTTLNGRARRPRRAPPVAPDSARRPEPAPPEAGR